MNNEVVSGSLERPAKARRVSDEQFELIYPDGFKTQVTVRDFRCLSSDVGEYVYGIVAEDGEEKYYEAYLDR